MNDEELTAEDEMIAEGGPAEPNPEEQDRTAALEAELADAKAATLYAQAETQNVRRRLEKDAQDARAYASTGFARDILSVADNLSRALDAIPAELRDDEKFKGLVVGLDATGRELEAVFQRNGITKMPSDLEPGTIVQEMQAGYMIKDRLLRPAMVGVAKAG
jgi:molecular chaperone GrpE